MSTSFAGEDSTREEPAENSHLRFHKRFQHLATPFGNGGFGRKAEAFARFFGTPLFLGVQTVIVALWIGANVFGVMTFDLYPFILLNLAFSLQAAYAAPLILLAQTRQAARDKGQIEADAQHREELAINAEKTSMQIFELLQQNTHLTEITKKLTERIETLTAEMHKNFISNKATT